MGRSLDLCVSLKSLSEPVTAALGAERWNEGLGEAEGSVGELCQRWSWGTGAVEVCRGVTEGRGGLSLVLGE